jgi:hypothetical protein
MLLSFLPPIGANQLRSPYLWVLYKQLTHFTPDQIALIGTAEYFDNPEVHLNSNRWDISDASREYSAFDIPTKESIDRYRKSILPDTLVSALLLNSENVERAVCRLLTERITVLEDAIRKSVREFVSTSLHIDCFLSWCRIPSLLSVASEFGIPVIHNELGALRGPDYHWTAYFDFQGVNGGTESKSRFEQFQVEVDNSKERLLTRAELLALNTNKPIEMGTEPNPDFPIGLALQVENDTNLIAFSDGWNNQRLIDEAATQYLSQSILVRRHPAGLGDYTQNLGVQDHSSSASEFILRCRTIATINSSVGLEALLLGRQAVILGDSPFSIAAQRSLDCHTPLPNAHLKYSLNFLLISYLIPYEFLYEEKYIQWRLQHPSEIEIYRRHRQYLQTRRQFLDTGQLGGFHLEDIEYRGLITFLLLKEKRLTWPINRMRDELIVTQDENSSMKSSRSWRITSPLRSLNKLFQEILIKR